MAVAAEVEEDGPLLPGLLRFEGEVDGRLDGVRHLRGRHDALGPGEHDASLEGRVLGVGPRLDEALVDEGGDDGRVAVVAQAAGVDAARHEGVA